MTGRWGWHSIALRKERWWRKKTKVEKKKQQQQQKIAKKKKGRKKEKKWIIRKMSVKLWGWRQDLKLWGDFVVA